MCKTSDRIAKGFATGGISELVPNANAPGAPNLPDYPSLTPEELEVIKKQNLSLDQFSGIISDATANRQVLQQITGLYNADGSINQGALDDLKGRVSGRLDLQSKIGVEATEFLGSFFDQPAVKNTADLIAAEQGRYRQALEGKLPVTPGLTQQKQREFEILKEAAGQRGIRIEGDSPESATSESTAGIRMVSDFNQRYSVLQSQEQQSALQTSAQNLGLLSGVQNTSFNQATGVASADIQMRLGLLGSSQQSGANLAPVIGQYISGQSQVAAPFASQRLGMYQQELSQLQAKYAADLNQYQGNLQFASSIGQLVGTVGAAAFTGGASLPASAASAAATPPARLGVMQYPGVNSAAAGVAA